MVLISPLCASVRNGCASAQSAEVLVLKRWWNVMNGEMKRSSARSGIEPVEGVGRHQRLVHDRPRRERDDGQPDAGGPGDALDPQARAIQRGVGGLPPFVEAGDHLQHFRGGVALRAQHGGAVGRDDAPVDGAGAGLAQLALDDFGGLQAIGRVDEQHAEAARAGGRQPAAERLGDPGPGNRGEDAAAVDRAERRLGAPVGQAPQRREAVRHDVAAGAAADVGDEPDPAGVVVG